MHRSLVLTMRGFVVGLIMVIMFTMWTTIPKKRENMDADLTLNVEGGGSNSNGRPNSDIMMVMASDNGGNAGAIRKEDVWTNRASYAERWGDLAVFMSLTNVYL